MVFFQFIYYYWYFFNLDVIILELLSDFLRDICEMQVSEMQRLQL